MPWIDSGFNMDASQAGEGCPCRGCRPVRENLATRVPLTWSGEGYYAVDYFPAIDLASDLAAPVYDEDGYDSRGYNEAGYDRDSYNEAGYDRDGYDREGYSETGYGYNGFDRNGFNYRGYDRDGYNRSGHTSDGYDRQGYDVGGFDRNGFNRAGFDRSGWNEDGFNASGDERPCDCAECRVATGRMTAPPSLPPSAGWRGTGELTDDQGLCQCGDRYCENSFPVDSWSLCNYTYTPEPLIFRRSHGEHRSKVPYYGLEIEMTSGLTTQERHIGEHYGLNGDLLYFKSDGSVDGFEMVSHPMTYKWATENFPWHVVKELADAGSSVRARDNGLHVHVSRAGFKDEAHLYRWLKFWYRNQDPVINIAGRDGGEWGNFSEEAATFHAKHAKARARARRGKGAQRIRTGETGGVRYVAINLENDNTVEVRIFASTTRTHALKYRFQLVAGSVEYTRNLSSKDVVKGGWKWDKFLLWLDGKSEEYPDLAMFEGNRITRVLEAGQPQGLLS